MKTKKYQLKNGLTVLLTESRKSPVVSVQMWVRTGSADESPSQAGISHFIEHLVFKGTKKFGVGEVASFVEGSGGELNAYTSFDQTVFHVTIASSKASVALESISEMMGFPRFDPEEIDKEREVVIEEIKRGNDSPGRRSSQLMFSTAFKKHPYGRPVIGYDRIIRKVSVATLKKYYRDRYCPRNMFLVVTGDFESARMKKSIEEFFGIFADYPVRGVKRVKEPISKSPLVKVEKTSFKETMVSATWKIPSVRHEDVPALDLLALILGQGDSSRLVRRLRIENALVHSVGTSAFTPVDAGLFALSMSLDAENADRALEIAEEELAKIRKEAPSAEEMAKALVCLASEQIYSMETVDGLSRSFGHMEFYLRDPGAFDAYLKKLKSLRSEDIVRIARKYLKPGTLRLTALTDGDPGKLASKLKKFAGRQKEFRAGKIEISRRRAKPLKLKAKGLGLSGTPVTERLRLPGGGLLLLRDERETPTVSLRIALGGGLLIEPEGKEGLTELFTRVWSAGGKKYDESAINLKVDSLAAGFGTFGGRNTMGMSADFISDFDREMWDLIEDVLISPTLPDHVLEREKEVLLRQIKFRRDNPAQVCMRAFSEMLFGPHPYAREMQGTERSLPAISMDDLREYHRRVFQKGNAAMCLTGDFSSLEWRRRLESFTERLPEGPSLIREVPHEAPTENVRKFQYLKKEQSHLVVGYRGLSLSDPRRWALQLMQAVLAGQGGRLFVELRDKKSLAYSVSPLRMEGLGTGYFGAYIACSPEKAELAESMIHEEFGKIADHAIPEEELERAKNFLVGRTAIDLQRKAAICNSLLFDEIYGLDSEESLRPAERYSRVTSEEIQKLAKEIFDRPSVTSLVGPLEPKKEKA
ncbi:MAG TPA: pitrilysin family protein [Pseudobdellovibrionaceae bacterium]|nr:pitrilysin family protein [Pseudobdellovibrionaceae bacterium]